MSDRRAFHAGWRRIAGAVLTLTCATGLLSGCSRGSVETSGSTLGGPTGRSSPPAIPKDTSCFGAAALAASADTCAPTTSGPLNPPASKAADDESDAYSPNGGHSDCFSHPPKFPQVVCSFGDKGSSVDVALVGNSHAGQWVPAMEQIATQRHWHLTTYLASQCALADTEQHFAGDAQSGCTNWVHDTTRAVTGKHYALVVMTNRVSVSAIGATKNDPASNLTLYRQGYAAELKSLAGSGSPVVVIHDTPAPGELIPDCLQKHSTDYAACNGKRSRWLAPDPAVDAVRDVGRPDITAVDLSNRICGPKVCAAVVGGVPVYKDGSHLTATYNRTLAPYLRPALARAITR